MIDSFDSLLLFSSSSLYDTMDYHPQAALVCFDREAAELVVLELYSFAYDAIGPGSTVRAKPPDCEDITGKCCHHPR